MNQTFMNNLNRYIKTNGFKYWVFAKEVDELASNIASWSKGKNNPSVRSMKKLADYMGVTMHELLFESPDFATPPKNFFWNEPEEKLQRNVRLLMADSMLTPALLSPKISVPQNTIRRIAYPPSQRFTQIKSVVPVAEYFGLTIDEIMYEDIYLRVR